MDNQTVEDETDVRPGRLGGQARGRGGRAESAPADDRVRAGESAHSADQPRRGPAHPFEPAPHDTASRLRFRVFPSDLEASGCYRIVYPYGHLEQQGGHEAIYTHRADDTLKTEVPRAAVGGPWDIDADEFLESDIYVFQRPLHPALPRVARFAKDHGKKVVVDLDDHFDRLPPNHAATKLMLTSAYHSSVALHDTIAHADVLTAPTELLLDHYGQQVPSCLLLQNRILERDWQLTPAYQRDSATVTVGWMGKMKYRDRDLNLLRGLLPQWLERHPQVTFLVVGDDGAHSFLGTNGLYLDGADFPAHAPLRARIDIGLIPLADSPFNEAKSALAGIEYGACGATYIATPTGPYRDWTDAGNGLLARKPRHWLTALDTLLDNDLWRTFAKANHEKALAESIDRNWQQWQQVAA